MFTVISQHNDKVSTYPSAAIALRALDRLELTWRDVYFYLADDAVVSTQYDGELVPYAEPTQGPQNAPDDWESDIEMARRLR